MEISIVIIQEKCCNFKTFGENEKFPFNILTCQSKIVFSNVLKIFFKFKISIINK